MQFVQVSQRGLEVYPLDPYRYYFSRCNNGFCIYRHGFQTLAFQLAGSARASSGPNFWLYLSRCATEMVLCEGTVRWRRRWAAIARAPPNGRLSNCVVPAPRHAGRGWPTAAEHYSIRHMRRDICCRARLLYCSRTFGPRVPRGRNKSAKSTTCDIYS